MWEELKKAAKEVRDEVGEERAKVWDGSQESRVAFEYSPVAESESNGLIERTIQSVQEQIRTIKDTIEFEADMKISSG
eukprot:3789282-Karenia_brevis.AAC.1